MTAIERSLTGWSEEVRRYTVDLTRIRSVSPSRDENVVAREIERLLTDGMEESASIETGLEPIPGDPWERMNVYAVVRGRSPQTVVLMGHLDTVDTQDYGALEPWALDPEGLAERLDALAAATPGVAEDVAAQPGEWMFGRGVADMKGGVAICIALMRHYARLAREGRAPLSLVMIATPDEENESAGARQAPRLLARLAERHGLRYAGAINTDYVTARFPGDAMRPIYTGSVGKLLPCFYAVGRSAHAGEPFAGVDANLLLAELVREFDMNPAYCERVRGQTTPPPVTLRATDTKLHYDTQLPIGAFLYVNLLTLERTPDEALGLLRTGAQAALARALERINEAADAWAELHGQPPMGWSSQPSGVVTTWGALRAEVAARLGAEAMNAALRVERERWPVDADKRAISAALAQRLWTLSGREGPAVVVYFAPPYYPAVPAVASPLLDALRDVIARRQADALVEEEYFPLLSDMSYLRLDASVDVSALVEHMPLWRDETAGGAEALPGDYGLPIQAMRALDMPVIDIGPYGHGVHQRGERAHVPFSFETAPQVIAEVIERLAERVGK